MRVSKFSLFSFFLLLVSFSGLAGMKVASSFSEDTGDSPAQEPLSSAFEMSETCVLCHEDKGANLKGTAHALPSPERPAHEGVKVFCQDCHVNPEKHLEDPTAETARRTEDMSAEELLAACSACHAFPHVREMATATSHFGNGVTCVACHKIHRPTEVRLLKKTPSQSCFECHTSVSETFSMPSHHPLNEGTLKCVSCHTVMSSFDQPFSQESARAVCVSCHTEYEGPLPYEHQALNDYAFERHGCLVCHEAHGSANKRLLKEPDERLCLQCHTVPRHFTAHGGVWSRGPCQNCHSDVHGSYTNKLYFDESMQTRPCFQAGCHEFQPE